MRRSLGKMSKRSRALGHAQRKLTVPGLMGSFKVGDVVAVDSQSQYSGMPHPRYRGRTGTVVGKRGDSYLVRITDGNAVKELAISPVHLER